MDCSISDKDKPSIFAADVEAALQSCAVKTDTSVSANQELFSPTWKLFLVCLMELVYPPSQTNENLFRVRTRFGTC